jgi:CRISPR/Cas system-associated exonuclease Cas4 (RecB family)
MSLERILKRHDKRFVTHKSDKVRTAPPGGTADSLKKSIDSYLLERNAPVFKKLNGFHPSYNQVCPRWWYLMFKGVEVTPKTDARLYRIFDNGHLMHERICGYLKEMGILVDREIPVKLDTPVPIVGTADGIIDWDGYKLIELKSISPEGFQFRKYYNKPKPEHNAQAQVYLRALNLEKGFIIYESKGSQELLIFEIERDDSEFEKKVKIWSKAYDYIQRDVLPPRPYKRDSSHCSECDLEKYCWEVLPDSDQKDSDT